MPQQIHSLDSQAFEEVSQFRDEEVQGPEVRVASLVAQTRALATAQLVVDDDWESVVDVQEAERAHVDAGGAWAAVDAH